MSSHLTSSLQLPDSVLFWLPTPVVPSFVSPILCAFSPLLGYSLCVLFSRAVSLLLVDGRTNASLGISKCMGRRVLFDE